MFALPDLPYAPTALEPVISANTLGFHHGKHHAGYVKTLNTRLAELPGVTGTLEEIIRQAEEIPDAKLFNNAAQCWNHSFFWLSMAPLRKDPGAELQAAIAAAFQDHAGLRNAFVAAGVGHFGSGWVWLMSDNRGVLSVTSTHDAKDMLPGVDSTPLLVCDLWEHAYYLDHQNDRTGFLTQWFDHLADWSFAGRQFLASVRNGLSWRHPRAFSFVA